MPTTTGASQRKLTPFFNLHQEYTDNLYFDEKNTTEDFITTLSPGILFLDRTERLDIDVSGKISQLLYAENSELDALDQHYAGNAQWRATPTTGLGSSSGYIKDSRPDRDIEETGLVLDARTRDRTFFTFSGDHAFTEKTAVSASYAYNEEDFEGTDPYDYKSNGIALYVGHNLGSIFPMTVGRLSFGFAQYEYTYSDWENYSLSLGIQRDSTETLSFLFDVGVRMTRAEFTVFRFDPAIFRIVEDIETETQWGGVVRFDVTYAGEYLNGTASLSHDVEPASGRDTPTKRTTVNGTLSRRFTDKFSGRISAGYILNELDSDVFTLGEIDSQTLRFNTACRYELTREVSLEAGYTLGFEFDNQADTEASRNLIYIQVSFSYPVIE